MSILLEFIPNFFIALAFDFILYITGACILRLASFGFLKYQLHSYSKFKEQKGKSHQGYFLPYLVGVLFYVLIVISIAWFY